ncbi:hypothetical protein AXG93_1335s1300 [Marchantia polymorpha subsp. ruderalis]|uniref:Uncharacterized protein n=1 Tax=Marchantia polymorpha subsp. ruderalis TaxID=1480154 RepID=A0A176W6E3_MARPO|nr:hypothetical protein AXG93_1335s1300 [Marchantia polymorpha subsp. ruderalis]
MKVTNRRKREVLSLCQGGETNDAPLLSDVQSEPSSGPLDPPSSPNSGVRNEVGSGRVGSAGQGCNLSLNPSREPLPRAPIHGHNISLSLSLLPLAGAVFMVGLAASTRAATSSYSISLSRPHCIGRSWRGARKISDLVLAEGTFRDGWVGKSSRDARTQVVGNGSTLPLSLSLNPPHSAPSIDQERTTGHGESLLLKVSDDVVVFVVDVFMEWLGFGDWSQRHSGVECSEGP